MAFNNITSEDRLVQKSFAEYLERVLRWDSVYTYNDEASGQTRLLGRENTRELLLSRDLRVPGRAHGG